MTAPKLAAPPQNAPALVRLLEAARQHGENSDDPEHEVGDLQEILGACWRHMSAAARAAVVREYADFVSEWLDNDPDTLEAP